PSLVSSRSRSRRYSAGPVPRGKGLRLSLSSGTSLGFSTRRFLLLMALIRPSPPGTAFFGPEPARPFAGPIRFVLIVVALVAALGPAPVRAAGLVISLDNVTGPTAGGGTFEVLLTNTH